MLTATVVSFTSFILILSHLSPRWLRRAAGYKAITDCILHGTILWMFLGTSTDGLLQAEAAGIGFSVFLRIYRYMCGYEIFDRKAMRWQRFTGLVNRNEAVRCET